MESFNVSEIFGPTVQGEGALCGKVTHFLRLAGCTYRCKWCDSMHAVDPKQIREKATHKTEQEIALRIRDLGGRRTAEWLTISGGDPLIWEIGEFLQDYILPMKLKVAVETQGILYKEWLHHCDTITCSPKGPSSGMQDHLDLDMLDRYVRFHGPESVSSANRLNFKVVVFTSEDLTFAGMIHERYPTVPFYLSCGTEPHKAFDPPETDDETAIIVLTKFRWLVRKALEQSVFKDVTVLPQMHSMIWGRRLGV